MSGTLLCIQQVAVCALNNDYYVAIYQLLYYTEVMHPCLRLQLVAMAWCCGFLNSFVMCPQTMKFSQRGCRRVDHFLCEMLAHITMSCEDTVLVEA